MFTYRHMCIEINTYHCSRRGSHVPNMYQITNSKVWNVAMPLSYHYGNDPMVMIHKHIDYFQFISKYHQYIHRFYGYCCSVIKFGHSHDIHLCF